MSFTIYSADDVDWRLVRGTKHCEWNDSMNGCYLSIIYDPSQYTHKKTKLTNHFSQNACINRITQNVQKYNVLKTASKNCSKQFADY